MSDPAAIFRRVFVNRATRDSLEGLADTLRAMGATAGPNVDALREVVRQWDEATESEADLSHMLPSPGWSVKA